MAETAASDVEAQGVKPTADSADAQQSVGVGVLGWLGFIIVNLAAWGIVGVTTAISWIFGLGVCLLYIALLIGLAFWLERSGSVYKQFINLLWVLAGWFVFIAGAYIAVRVVMGSVLDLTRPESRPVHGSSIKACKTCYPATPLPL